MTNKDYAQYFFGMLWGLLIAAMAVSGVLKPKVENLQRALSTTQKSLQEKCPAASFEEFMKNAESFGNRDTVIEYFRIRPQIDHWIPGRAKMDTIIVVTCVRISTQYIEIE